MSDDYLSELEDEFGEVMSILSEGPLEPPIERPSEDVWASIASGAGLAADTSAAGSASDGADGEKKRSRKGRRAGGPLAAVPDAPVADGNGQVSGTAGGNVIGMHDRASQDNWRRRAMVAVAAAAAVLLVAVPLALTGGSSQTAELAALGAFSGSGRAEVSDGTLELQVEGLITTEGSFYELWLLDIDDGELVDLRSLGQVSGDGTYQVPDDIDLDEFSVVDISIEPDDGDPTHSGASVLQGPLEES